MHHPSQGPSDHRERSGVHVSLCGPLCGLQWIRVLLASPEPGDLAAGAPQRMGSRGGVGLGAGTVAGAPRHGSPPVPSGSLFSVNRLPPGVGLDVHGRAGAETGPAAALGPRASSPVRARPSCPSTLFAHTARRPASGVSVSCSPGTCASGADGKSAFPRPGGLCRGKGRDGCRRWGQPGPSQDGFVLSWGDSVRRTYPGRRKLAWGRDQETGREESLGGSLG